MADEIKILTGNAKKEIDSLNQSLVTGGEALLLYIENAKKLSTQLKGSKGLKEFTNGTDEVARSQEKIKQTTKEITEIIKKRERAERKLSIQLSDAGKEQALLAEQTRRAAKANREQAKEALDGVSAYNQMSKALGKVRGEAKDLAASLFKMKQEGKQNTKEYKKLEKQFLDTSKKANILDKGVKDIDASLGLHQRNVGNYSSALEGMTPIIERVNSKLALLGTSVSQLSSSKQPFAPIISGLKSLIATTVAFIATPIGATLAIFGSLFALIKANKDTVVEFDSGLRSVGKTADLQGEQLEALGDSVIQLSNQLKVVETSSLLEIAAVAGQLGVKGTENILKFSETLAKLETASDIAGEEGASNIARLLTLTDGGVQNIKDFGDEVTILGNNFAATENEILSNATLIAQNTSQYKIGRQATLAYATATKAVGLEAQITGSAIGRTLGVLEESIRTGKNLDAVQRLTGLSAKELNEQFKENASGVLTKFIEGLNKVSESGGSVKGELDAIGLGAIGVSRVLAPLATEGFGTLTLAIDKSTAAAGALDTEFKAASLSLENQSKRFGIAWDNVVLSVENGQGVFSQIAGAIINIFAGVLEQTVVIFQMMNTEFQVIKVLLSDLAREFGITTNRGVEFNDVLKLLSFILTSGVRSIGNFVRGLSKMLSIFVTLTRGVKAFASEVRFQFGNIKGIINSLDITKPITSLKKAIKDLTSLRFGSTMKNEFNKMNADAQLKNTKNILKDLSLQMAEMGKNRVQELQNETIDEPLPDPPPSIDEPKIAAAKKTAKSLIDIEIEKLKKEQLLREEDLRLWNELNSERLTLSDAMNRMESEVVKIALDQQYRKRLENAKKRQELEKKELEAKNASNVEFQAMEARHEAELVALRANYAKEKQHIDDAVNKAYEKGQLNRLQAEILMQKNIIDATITDEELKNEKLLELEKEYQKKKLIIKKEALEKIEGLNQEEIEKKIKTNESLTDAELEFYELLQELREFDKEQKEDPEEEVDKKKESLEEIGKLLGKEAEITQLYEEIKRFENAETQNQKVQAVAGAIGTVGAILGKESDAGKALAATSAIMNTYSAAAAALAPPPIGSGPLFGPILAGVTIAAGFANVRKILSTPKPKFAGGTTNAPEGFAITQEVGAELITDKKGRVKSFGHNKGDAMTYLAKGDKVYTASQTKKMLENIAMPIVPTIKPSEKSESINYTKIEKGFKNALTSKPTESIVYEDGKAYLYVVKNGSTKKRPINLKPNKHNFQGLR